MRRNGDVRPVPVYSPCPCLFPPKKSQRDGPKSNGDAGVTGGGHTDRTDLVTRYASRFRSPKVSKYFDDTRKTEPIRTSDIDEGAIIAAS